MQEKILVVDDDREIVGAIALLLEAEGYTVLRAYNGMEALDMAVDPDIRLILMDVMMPAGRALGCTAHPATAKPAHHRPLGQERGHRQGAGAEHGSR